LRKFWAELFFFFGPLVFSFLVLEIIGGQQLFAFRPWEALKYNVLGQGREFYPNQSIEMTSVGDLCRGRECALERKQRWETDSLGYRNRNFVRKADIVVVGDSFVAGAGLSQEDIFSSKLDAEMGEKFTIYNIAPGNISTLRCLLEKGVIEKPKVVVFSTVERNIPPVLKDETNCAVPARPWVELEVLADRFLRAYPFKWLGARFRGDHGVVGVRGVADLDGAEIFFYKGRAQTDNLKAIEKASKVIKSYQRFLAKQGIDFVYLPIPNKETVYFERVPFQNQPRYLKGLTDKLDGLGVSYLDSLPVFNQARSAQPGVELFIADDTHWNERGVELVSKALSRLLKDKLN